MSEVEKMYKNAEIEKITITYYCNIRENEDCPHENDNILCKECVWGKPMLKYPPFTAEKQISILQFCLKWGQVHILKGIDDEYRIENSCYRRGYQLTIADAIANYINEKWEKLTPEERKQIKEILE